MRNRKETICMYTFNQINTYFFFFMTSNFLSDVKKNIERAIHISALLSKVDVKICFIFRENICVEQ